MVSELIFLYSNCVPLLSKTIASSFVLCISFLLFLMAAYHAHGQSNGDTCHGFSAQNGQSLPNMFGVPWHVLGGNETTVNVTCADPQSAFQVGAADPNYIVWKTAYTTTNNGTEWDLANPITLTGGAIDESGNWLRSTAVGTKATDADYLNEVNYIATYQCVYHEEQWKCGCNSANCGEARNWTIQSFSAGQINNPNTGNGQGTGDQNTDNSGTDTGQGNDDSQNDQNQDSQNNSDSSDDTNGDQDDGTNNQDNNQNTGDQTGNGNTSNGGSQTTNDNLPPPGNPNGSCPVPQAAQAVNTSGSTNVIGNGTAASCTGQAVVEAVARGGIITFNCGSEPVTIRMTEPAKIVNNTGPEIVIDGGNLVTLDGGGSTRLLYMNTCDSAQGYTTSQCQNQDHPRLTVQNMTFINASAGDGNDHGGGAIYTRGGVLKVVNSRFFNNRCAPTGPDTSGAAIRATSIFNNGQVYVVNSTFGGRDGLGNSCSNGGGLGSIGTSWTVINSLFSHNSAIGRGGNPAQGGTPGGGIGGAIYNDGRTMTLRLCGTRIENNSAVQHGSAIFFVTNNRQGNMIIDRSTITNNSGGSWYPQYPQISGHAGTNIQVTDSTIE